MGEPAKVVIRAPREDERGWVEGLLRDSWGSTVVVSRGQAHDASRLPALIAVACGEYVGLATFRFVDDCCELVTLDALRRRAGIGSALLEQVALEAAGRECRRLWLVTTNDNREAIRFYRRQGLRLAAVHRGAVDEARRLKPSIPLVGRNGIHIHDELEFELGIGCGDMPRRQP